MIGGGYGSIQRILKSNKNLLRKSSWLKNKRSFSERKIALQSLYKGELEFKDVSSIDLNKLKREIRLKKKKEAKINNIIIVSVLLLMLVFFSCLYVYYRNTQNKLDQQNKIIALKKYNAKYLPKFTFCIEDGDKWLAKEHYKNAIYQYTKALAYFPNNMPAKRKLKNAYKMRCEKVNIDCDKLKK